MSRGADSVFLEDLVREDHQEILNMDNSVIDFIQETCKNGIFLNTETVLEDAELDEILEYELEEEEEEYMNDIENIDLTDPGEIYLDVEAEKFEDAEDEEDGDLIDAVCGEEPEDMYYHKDDDDDDDDEEDEVDYDEYEG